MDIDTFDIDNQCFSLIDDVFKYLLFLNKIIWQVLVYSCFYKLLIYCFPLGNLFMTNVKS